MKGKNDLSGFKKRKTSAPSVLSGASASKNELKPASKPISAEKPQNSTQNSEALVARCQMLVTVAEKEKIKADRGAIPESAYLRIKLKEAGVI